MVLGVAAVTITVSWSNYGGLERKFCNSQMLVVGPVQHDNES